MVLFDILNKLNIQYDLVEHKAVFNCEQAQEIKKLIDGIGCKNLFVTDKHSFYLIILKDDKKADLKSIAQKIGTKRLSFCSDQQLMDILKLKIGSVSPFGIVNDSENKVTLLIDSDLKNKKLLFHPNINTKTISIEFDDLIKFIEYEKDKYILIQ